jgi:hypothetical protein
MLTLKVGKLKGMLGGRELWNYNEWVVFCMHIFLTFFEQ